MDFQLIYANLNIPVIVVDFPDKHIIYMNSQAQIILDVNDGLEQKTINDVIKCKDPNSIQSLMETINENETIQNYQLLLEDDILLEITGNIISEGILILYLREVSEIEKEVSYNTVFRNVFGMAFSLQDVDEILASMLKAAGLGTNINCSFIFEEANRSYRYAYEWRSLEQGTVSKRCTCRDINIINSSFDNLLKNNESIIINDINEIDVNDAAVFSVAKVRAVALFPLFVSNKYFGFIGFADCTTVRKWSNNDLSIFKDTTNLVSEVYSRRQMEQIVADSQKVISNVLDNINTNIYVADYETNELLFVNKHLINEMEIKEPFKGKKCWELIHKNMSSECSFCEKHLLFDKEGNYTGTRKREFMNTITGKWYYVQDSLIKWIDGRVAFLETSIEFSERKALEEELRYHASTDVMTQSYNRAWGLKLLHEVIVLSQQEDFPVAVCFIDVDGLKFVNDKYGHSEGDDLLLTIVNAIKNNIMEHDILSRLGGDEFLIIFKNSTYEQAEKMVQNTMAELDNFNNTHKKPYTCSFCYGLNQLEPDNTITIDEIISFIDAKMYEQKVVRRKLNFEKNMQKLPSDRTGR